MNVRGNKSYEIKFKNGSTGKQLESVIIMKRVTKSKESLEKDFHIFYEDGKFYQTTVRAGIKEIKPFVNVQKHKYGKTLCYEIVAMYSYKTHKQVMMSYHSFLYAWFKGEVPAGYDVDHIDGDPLNNDLDNLQLLTRKENLAKRGGGKNQYTVDREAYLRKRVKSVRDAIDSLLSSNHTAEYVDRKLEQLEPELKNWENQLNDWINKNPEKPVQNGSKNTLN